ncbi:MAG: glycosyltransferase [Paludibacteraceae bacterium]
MKRAVVCVTNDLATDQRVHKTCTALVKCGYDVTETGRLLPDSLPLKRSYKTRRIKHFFNKGALFYAEYNIRLFCFLIFADVDLIYTNDLDTLLGAYLASKIRRKQIIYDTHEYFTEVPELVSRPKVQKVWEKIEKSIFPRLDRIITVNNSISNLYIEKYHKKITVVRNIPPTFIPEKLKTREELNLPPNKNIVILQGTGINMQRGAEEACMSMKYLTDNFLLLICGNGDALPTLKKIVQENKLGQKVIFMPKMPFSDLRQYTMNADLGLAIDKDTNLNYHFSLPNKLFDYIHSEIPVLSSKLVELENIINQYDVGYFIQNHDPKHIAETIEFIFENKQEYLQKKQNTRKAKQKVNWENEEKILIRLIESTNTAN